MNYRGLDGAQALLREIVAALPAEPGMTVGELERRFPGVDLDPVLDLLLACAAVGYSHQKWWRIA